jgi:hypothetical protein
MPRISCGRGAKENVGKGLRRRSRENGERCEIGREGGEEVRRRVRKRTGGV